MARNRLHSVKSKLQTGGFTIVETLIVLAVTSLLFVAAVALVNGRQSQTEFMTSIHDAQQQLQQIINETQSGYSGGATFNCDGTASAHDPTITGAGINKGCSFIGKVILFGNNGAQGDSQLTVLPVVGKQQTTSGGVTQQVQDIHEAYPTAVYTAGVDGTTTYTLQDGLTIYAPKTNAGAFGVVSNFGTYNSGATCGGLCSTSQQFSLYTISNTSPSTDSISQAASAIGATGPSSGGANFQTATSPVTLCLVSGGTNQSGLIEIASDGSLAVRLMNIMDNQTCA